MKYQEGEGLENWAKRVKMFEQGLALQRIAKGESPEEVMEDMARRIVDKLLYPIIGAIKQSSVKEQNTKSTLEVSGEIPRSVADHVVDE